MKKLAMYSAILFFACAGAANAVTLDVTLGNTNNSVSYASVAGFNTSNVVLSSPGNVTLTNNAQLISAPPYSVTNQYLEPSVGTLNGGSYLAVLGSSGNPGFATFTLGAGFNTFGFTWGTIDTYNSLTITDSTLHTFTISGTTILNQLLIPLSQSGAGGSQTDISFIDPFGTIKSAVFTTPQNSFETANFFESRSTVPVPASLGLFLTALLGLGFFAFRRRRQQRA